MAGELLNTLSLLILNTHMDDISHAISMSIMRAGLPPIQFTSPFNLQPILSILTFLCVLCYALCCVRACVYHSVPKIFE